MGVNLALALSLLPGLASVPGFHVVVGAAAAIRVGLPGSSAVPVSHPGPSFIAVQRPGAGPVLQDRMVLAVGRR